MRDQHGRWLPGAADDGRHLLSRADRRKGYRVALARAGRLADGGRLYAWLWRRVRGHYRDRERGAGHPASGGDRGA